MSTREFEIVLFGATGFTGRLTAEYLASKQMPSSSWAIAGRNEEKLEALALGVPTLVVDALDADACREVASRAKVVCTTVGPYTKYGGPLVAACAEEGTHYCDLTGEPNFMRATIDAHHERAKQTGARIVHTCGFDSIPSDLGTYAGQEEFRTRYGRYARKATAFFGEMSGTFSGGTYASMFAVADAMKQNPASMPRGPYALDPDPSGPKPRVDRRQVGWDPTLKMFFVPFIMAGTNGPVVRRGHALAGYPYGRDFTYREVMSTPGNARGAVMAAGITAGLAGFGAVLMVTPLRKLLQKRLPKPGEGPSRGERERGHWKARILLEDGDDKLLYLVGDPHGDPGYKSTSKMLGESALCLAYDSLTSEGGVLTPSVAMDGRLVERLRAAGLYFEPGELPS